MRKRLTTAFFIVGIVFLTGIVLSACSTTSHGSNETGGEPHTCEQHICEECDRSCDLHVCPDCERICEDHICDECNRDCDLHECEVCDRICTDHVCQECGRICKEHVCEICERVCDKHICEECDRTCDLHVCHECGKTCELHTCDECERTCELHVCEICERICNDHTCDECNRTCDEHICEDCDRTCEDPNCDTCHPAPETTPVNLGDIQGKTVTNFIKLLFGENATITDDDGEEISLLPASSYVRFCYDDIVCEFSDFKGLIADKIAAEGTDSIDGTTFSIIAHGKYEYFYTIVLNTNE